VPPSAQALSTFMMTITLTQPCFVKGTSHQAGETLLVSEDIGYTIVGIGRAYISAPGVVPLPLAASVSPVQVDVRESDMAPVIKRKK